MERNNEPVKQEPVQEPTVTERQFKLAMKQWEDWKAYALELQARLVKYEGGLSMVLNAAPVSAKREWVDLTDDEIGAVMDFGYATDSELENARDVIAAFKEKNK